MLHLIKSVQSNKKIILNVSVPLVTGYCLFLKNQECRVRKVIADNDYMTFPYKIGIKRCFGSCNNENILILRLVYQIVLKILLYNL